MSDLFEPEADMPQLRIKPIREFGTAKECVEKCYRHSLGEATSSWTYRDADGNPIGLALRWNLPDGSKEYRPVFRIAGAWSPTYPKERPLYGLDLLASRPSETVYLVEGEKCAEALRALGLLGVSCAGGSQSHGHADLSPLAGREVVILPDHDEPGEKHAAGLLSRLERLDPPAKCVSVRLPRLEVKEDVVEFIGRVHAGDADAAKEEILELAAIALEGASPVSEWPQGWEPALVHLLDASVLQPPEVLRCGFEPWDRCQPFGGIERSTLHLITAPPGCFKTTTMQRLATGYASNGLRVAWLAGEMSTRALVRRFLAMQARCSVFDLVMRKGPDWEATRQAALEAVRPALSNLHIHGDGLGFEELEYAASRFDVVFLDYLQLVRCPNEGAARHEQLEGLMRRLAYLTRTQRAAWVCAGSMSRGSGDRDVFSAAKGSSAIEYTLEALYCCDEPPAKDEDGKRPEELECRFKCHKQREGEQLPFVVHVRHGRILEPEEVRRGC